MVAAAATKKGAATAGRRGQGLLTPADLAEATGKGAISLLQEFVQCSRREYQQVQQQQGGPQMNRPVLQWTYDTRMADFAALKFRATVAFMLDGIPHHVAGDWHLAKKLAQRDTAERALVFFVGHWGEYVLAESQPKPNKPPKSAQPKLDAYNSGGSSDTLGEQRSNLAFAEEFGSPECYRLLQKVESFCNDFPACKGHLPRWEVRSEEGKYRTLVEVMMFGVPHKFGGQACDTRLEACMDTARRTAWYLQVPGFENLYAPDQEALAAATRSIPAPPEQWFATVSTDGVPAADEDAQALAMAERKTALMRVQNRLQQAFAKQLGPGQSVWEWRFETDCNTAVGWQPVCRATARVPVANREFVGDWAQTQRDAQLNVCDLVTLFLDGLQNGNSQKSAS
eukprot:TRINITY_DN5907_c0_g1_i1.p1 TRINITY_DN5907_c0_g1~~TRINITY_DN5907_c0_g1_i1.p1  ORF type:complete len:397 (-),score=102.12 TRINITY_DN5907_c0_g1_i1:654-1844(-)